MDSMTEDGNLTGGRFSRILENMERVFNTCGIHHDALERSNSTIIEDIDTNFAAESRKKRSVDEIHKTMNSQDESNHENGDRLMHVISGMRKWAEQYLYFCPNQNLVSKLRKIEDQWRKRFQNMQSFKDSEIESRASGGQPRSCGAMYKSLGLRGHKVVMPDGKEWSQFNDPNWRYEVESLKAEPGCWIGVYEHENFEGFSAVCSAVGKSSPESCDLTGGLGYGPLIGNAALSSRCFCDQPTYGNCGMLYHWSPKDDQHTVEPGVQLHAGDKIPFIHKHFNQPMHYFTAHKCDGQDPSCETFDLERIQVNKPGCRLNVYKEEEWKNQHASAWLYQQDTSGKDVTDEPFFDFWGQSNVSHDLQSATCNCNFWITHADYQLEDGKDINTIITEKWFNYEPVDVFDDVMFNGQTKIFRPTVKKTHKWHSVIRNNFAKSDIALVQYHWDRMAEIPFPNFGDNNIRSSEETKFTKSDLDSDNVIERTQEQTLSFTANCFTGGNPFMRCKFGGRKIPISGTVTMTWNTGEKTEHVWESEHWYYDITPFRVAG